MTRLTKASVAERATWLIMWAEGHNDYEIANATGFGHRAVRNWFKRQGLPSGKTRMANNARLGPLRAPVVDRFFRRVVQRGECWQWTGALNPGGYARFKPDSTLTRTIQAHRWAYEFFVADIPDGLELDHLCRNRGCVNPWHLEPVTPWVNVMRSTNRCAVNAGKSRCPRGHEYNTENTYYNPRMNSRTCRTCKRENQTRRDAQKRGLAA